MSFKKFWPGDVNFIHVTNVASVQNRPHDYLVGDSLDEYDVLLHNYCARLCFEGYVSEDYKRAVRAFQGIKILSVQDEYDRTNELKAAIKDLGFDIVLTCIPPDQIELVYPKSEFPNVTFVTVLTGYVPADTLRLDERLPLHNRPIMVGYRGRSIAMRYGKLGFEKFEIGRRMKKECTDRGIRADIEMEESHRIYGDKWTEFLRSCRVMLGSESGSNVFDFTGELDERFKGITCSDKNARKYLQELSEIESKFDIGQISPRVFECAMNYTPMVLFEGRYSGAIQPNRHYVPLKKDFSNIDEVISYLSDTEYLEKIATNAHKALIESGDYDYKNFVAKVLKQVEKIGTKCAAKPKVRIAAPSRPSSLNDRVTRQFPTDLPKHYTRALIEAELEVMVLTFIPELENAIARYEALLNDVVKATGFSKWQKIRQSSKRWVRLVGGIVWRTWLQALAVLSGGSGEFRKLKVITYWHWGLIKAAVGVSKHPLEDVAYLAMQRQNLERAHAKVAEYFAFLEGITELVKENEEELSKIRDIVASAQAEIQLVHQNRVQLASRMNIS
ncbi:MAG: hypothetical protein CML99_06470 [Rhodobiaceae bacterium]|nr:hypothetical protein [Rhodobiaceae bacterium]